MRRYYGDPYDPYISNTSKLELIWEKSCVLRHLPSLDEVHFCWSDTSETDMVGIHVIPGYCDAIALTIPKFPEILLERGKVQIMSRKIGREVFKYLNEENGWVLT